MINTSKIMANRKEFERLAIEKAGLLPIGEYSTCEWHGKFELFQILATDEVVCPKCYLEAKNKRFEIEETTGSLQYKDKEKKRYMQRYSIFGGRSFLNKGFKGFDAKSKQELEARDTAMALSKEIAGGKVMNAILTGPAGTGKSHLAHSILFNINEMSAEYKNQLSCLFVDFTSVMELITASYGNTATDKKTAEYYIELMKTADVLVLDDLGTESSRADTNKQASDHTYKTLFKVLNAREGTKSTIISTNLTYDQLKAAYDARITSRISMNLRILYFSEIADKRPGFGF
jgi:DNA replication protein DnaC